MSVPLRTGQQRRRLQSLAFAPSALRGHTPHQQACGQHSHSETHAAIVSFHKPRATIAGTLHICDTSTVLSLCFASSCSALLKQLVLVTLTNTLLQKYNFICLLLCNDYLPCTVCIISVMLSYWPADVWLYVECQSCIVCLS